MKPRTKKLLLAFVVFLIIGMVAIGWLQKNKPTDSGKANKDKPEPEPKKSKSSSGIYTPAEPTPISPPVYSGVPIRKADKETIKAVQTDLNRAAIFTFQQPIKVDGVWGKQTQNFAKAVIGRDIADMTYQQFVNRNANVTGTVSAAASQPAVISEEAKDLANKLHNDFNQTFSDYNLYQRLNAVSDQTLRGIVAQWERFKIFHNDKSLFELLDPKNYNAFGAATLVSDIRAKLSKLGLK